MAIARIVAALAGVALLSSCVAAPYEHTFVLKEQLGYGWEADFVHRTIEVEKA